MIKLIRKINTDTAYPALIGTKGSDYIQNSSKYSMEFIVLQKKLLTNQHKKF